MLKPLEISLLSKRIRMNDTTYIYTGSFGKYINMGIMKFN